MTKTTKPLKIQLKYHLISTNIIHYTSYTYQLFKNQTL